jgi:tetratricopeptide (TPR) repeat protein
MFLFSSGDSLAQRALSVGLATLFFVTAAAAQERMPTPWASPASEVSQVIGITDVTVTYGRPAVKGRAIWGSLVPYDQVWRAGANENTTISFQHDMKLEGQPLAAGVYGFHTIPHKDKWTLIFSRNATSWGSYRYDPAEDALRVDVTPVAAEFTEWLAYEFVDLGDSKATLRLRWDKLAVPLHITVDTPAIVMANARDVYLRGIPGFTWQGWNSAASYALMNKVNLDEALAWSERSVRMEPHFANLWTQGGLLEAMGKGTEAKATKDKALAMASETDLNTIGYEYLSAGHTEEALAIFRRNVEAHPESWNVYDSLAEALATKGDKQQAIELYGKALSMTSDEAQKTRIRDTLKALGG